jgi:hypothetical protein
VPNKYVDKLKKVEDRVLGPETPPLGIKKTIAAVGLLAALGVPLSMGITGGIKFLAKKTGYKPGTLHPGVKQLIVAGLSSGAGYAAGKYRKEIERNLGL